MSLSDTGETNRVVQSQDAFGFMYHAGARPLEIGDFESNENSSKLPISTFRLRPSTIRRDWKSENFYSDKSRIVFCSSFRRMMEKAQVFPLESNTSVRNRLTHSLEVADIGRTLARKVGRELEKNHLANAEDTECIQSIVESACLLHDIGNPPFGHFAEEAIKRWFRERAPKMLVHVCNELPLVTGEDARLNDFCLFDGNPQGFRIATRLHYDVDPFSLNLTSSTLLATVKYPNCGSIAKDALFGKKLGIFSSERELYEKACTACSVRPGHRYFLAYLTELADDICYCLSDIGDSFEKRIITSREFKEDFKKICAEYEADVAAVLPEGKIEHFGHQVAIPLSRRIMDEAATQFVSHFEDYLDGTANELSENLSSGKILKCFKAFSRKFIYTHPDAQRIEIAGSRIVEGLLDHFGRLLGLTRSDFEYFVERGEMRKNSGRDIEWRIFNQLSKRMIRVYTRELENCRTPDQEWIARARLIVDYISGMTDDSALRIYQNFMGIRLEE